MRDEELTPAMSQETMVKVSNHDYDFYGIITTVWKKRRVIKGKSPWRCVVENVDGVSLIQSAKNLEIVFPTNRPFDLDKK